MKAKAQQKAQKSLPRTLTVRRAPGQPLLSICMIVKNEDAKLERCLKSLETLRASIDCELIIADTGSTDRTWEIAEQYADVLYHFPWVNDFAAARNSGIERAKGFWFFILDADEELVSCTDMIEFMQSQNPGHDCASFSEKNFLGESDYALSRTVRLFLNIPHHRYTSTVHEQMQHLISIKPLTDMLYHYGYSAQSSILEKSAERNLPLLLSELARGNVSEHLYLQLAQEYYILNRPEDVHETIQTLFHALSVQNPNFSLFTPNTICARVIDAKAYALSQDWNQALETALQAEQLDEPEPVSNLEVYSVALNSQMHMLNTSASLDYGFKYLTTYKKWKNKELDECYLNGLSLEACNPRARDKVISLAIYAVTAETESAIPKLLSYADAEYAQVETAEFFQRILPPCLRHDGAEALAHYLTVVLTNNAARAELDALYRTIESYTLETPASIAPLFNALNMNTLPDAASQRLLAASLVALDPPSTASALSAALAAADADPNRLALLLLYALRHQEHLDAVLCAIPYAFIAPVSHLIETQLLHRKDALLSFILNPLAQESLALILWKTIFSEKLLLAGIESPEENIALFLHYTTLLASYANNVYSPALFHERDAVLLPAVFRFGAACQEALVLHQQGNSLESIKHFIKAAAHYPIMLPYPQTMLKQFETQLQESPEQKELRLLGIQVKQNILQLIHEKNLEAAKTLLLQYTKIAPQDTEIAMLNRCLLEA